MGPSVRICTLLVGLNLAGSALGQDELKVEVDKLRLEIARYEASLSECRTRLKSIEQQLASAESSEAPACSCAATALSGFCPVALADKWKWKSGRADIVRIYDGLLYRFSSERAAKKFDKDPDRYCLVIQGDDPVIAMRESRRVPGCREYGGRWNERIYLFAGRESYLAFQDSPEKYARFALHVPPSDRSCDPWQKLRSRLSGYWPAEAWIVWGFLVACDFPLSGDR